MRKELREPLHKKLPASESNVGPFQKYVYEAIALPLV